MSDMRLRRFRCDPLRVEQTDWESVFDRRRKNFAAPGNASLVHRRTKSRTGRRADRGIWLAGFAAQFLGLEAAAGIASSDPYGLAK